MRHILKLDDATVEELFGAEDAENETADRFRQYFYFNKAYDSLTSELPIRILVGHKGIGKSALLRRAYLRDQDNKRVSVYIRPSDLTEHRQNPDASDFNILVEQWKRGLLSSIAVKVIEDTAKASIEASELKRLSSSARGFVSGVAKLLVKYAEKKLDPSSAIFVKSFADNKLINVYRRY